MRIVTGSALMTRSSSPERRFLSRRIVATTTNFGALPHKRWRQGPLARPRYRSRARSRLSASRPQLRRVPAYREGRNVPRALHSEPLDQYLYRRNDSNPELLVPVANFRFDPARICVPEGIAQGLRRDTVNLVPQQRPQIP